VGSADGKRSTSSAGKSTRLRISTPFGRDLLILSNGSAIAGSDFVAKRRVRQSKPSDALLSEAAQQVQAYFERRLARFTLPLVLDGSQFCIAVWQAVAALAFGQFVSYSDVARAVGRPLAHRGVARAMALTPLALFVPAHRVVGSDGRLRGAAPRSMRRRLVMFERGYS